MNYSSLFKFFHSEDGPELCDLGDAVCRLATERFSGTTPRTESSGQAEPDKKSFRREDFNELATLGLTSMHIPEKLGGLGLSSLAQAGAIYELAKAELGPAIYISVHQMVTKICANGDTNSNHRELLSKLLSGETLGAFCLTEANAGSDAAAIRTTAVETEAGYELNGEKIYISMAPFADVFLVFAKHQSTRPLPESDELPISAFMVPANTPGLVVSRAERKMGCESAPIASVNFSNCRISHASLLGNPGEGFKHALNGLSGGRVNIAAAACGLASSALEKSLNYIREREQFGKKIFDFQGIQFMVAELITQLRASIALTREAAIALDSSARPILAAAAAKLFATDSAMKITTDCVQLLGGAGYLEEYKVEGLMRDAKMLQIVEGTNQIQRLIIAREISRLF